MLDFSDQTDDQKHGVQGGQVTRTQRIYEQVSTARMKTGKYNTLATRQGKTKTIYT